MTKKLSLKRRDFLATGAAAVGSPMVIPRNALSAPGRGGANDRLNVAHIGFGGRARGLFRDLSEQRAAGEAQSVAVADVDDVRLANAYKELVDGQPENTPKIDVYRDYRYILQRDDIDAVVIGTPDHQHAVPFVHSAECGKHIYCEKPACCTVAEGLAMVRAAEESGVATQIGSQGRSQPEAYLMHRYLANGVVGNVHHVECFHYPSPTDNSQTPDSDPPPEFDWDFWLGPLRWRPYNKKYHHGVFRWLLESGGGQIRDRGAHVMSCAMHWMGADGTGPVTVEATGTPPIMGLWDSAVLMEVKYTFQNPDWTMTWTQMEEKDLPAAEERTEEDFKQEGVTKISRPGYGAIYHGDQGRCMHWGGDGGTWAEKKVRTWKPPAHAVDVYKSPGHMEDWFQGIRTGADTIMNVKAGVGVANLCVLGNLAYILGRKLQWDQEKMTVVNDPEAERMMTRPQRYPYHM